VRQARAAEHALKMLAAGEVELVVSELDLGQQDGLKLLAEVRRNPWGESIPWIVLTGRSSREDALTSRFSKSAP
jgi:DNA-binding response OmpR family regulator